jgi:hypothetical protein
VSKVKVKATVGEARCFVHVVGTTMACPLCGYIVKSGERHECSRPQQPLQPSKRPKARRS